MNTHSMGVPCLETREFTAYIADNSAFGIHRAGYNGIASLIPKDTGNNLFVPSFSGLNYETIGLRGLGSYMKKTGFLFEPRSEPMHIEESGEKHVVLVQPETSHAHVDARITFTVEEPYYLHQRIELTFHRRFCRADEKNEFRSLWASYIHMPPDRHIYVKTDPDGSPLANWVGITKKHHRSDDMYARPLPDNRELTPEAHLAAMTAAETPTTEGWSLYDRESLHAYYGFCHDDRLLIMMFKQPEMFRLAYSPCGAGKQPAWNPAWDYVLYLPDAELNRTYCWELCLALKRYRGRDDILDEWRQYLAKC